jgi:HK97 family phage prohead protease
MKIERRALPNQLAAVAMETRDDGQAKIVGYASVFYDNTPQTEYPLWTDCVERIMPGCFNRAMQEDDCRALFNHDPNCVLGRTTAGTCRLSIDAKGLRYEVDPPDTQLGHDLAASLNRGDITGSSFSFSVTDQAWITTESGVDVREIRGVKLYDVGPVTFPAYEATTAGVRREAELEEALAAHAAYRRQQQADADGVEVALRMLDI